MKYVSDHGTEVYVHSPAEVLSFRENRSQGKENKLDAEIPLHIAQKFTQIHKVHGYIYEQSSMNLFYAVQHDLLFSYNFKRGYQYRFGPGKFPDYIQKDEKMMHEVIEYTQKLLEALGWVITFSEDESWFYFNFGPLLALTPEEVQSEIDQRINTLAATALQVINAGLLKSKSKYSRREVGLVPGLATVDERYLVISRLRELLGNQWFIKDWDGYNFEVIPNNPNQGW